MWIALIVCLTVLFCCEGSTIIDAVSDYQKKKLIEEHKTTNLALVYQILSTRPELSLEEVMMLVDMEQGRSKIKENKKRKHQKEQDED